MYSYDVYEYFLRLVPWFLRWPIFCAWLKVMASGLQPIVDGLAALNQQTMYFLQFNGQICYLEQVLNETFPSSGVIYIENVFSVPLFWYNKIEERPPFYLWNRSEDEIPTYLYNEGEYNGLFQFIVYVPLELEGQELQIIDLINSYAYAGTTYTIQYY